MLPSVKNEVGAKTKVSSKREEKKRINIRWNSTLLFQAGLVMLLLLSFLAMESDWSLGSGLQFTDNNNFELKENGLLSYRLEEPEAEVDNKVDKPVKPRVIQKPVSQSFIPVDGNSKLPETNLPPTELQAGPSSTGSLAPSPDKNPASSSYDTVQFVPIFPGCESLSNNEDRKACMSEKINTFINRKFNTAKFSDLETGKIHRVNVLFTIGRDGLVKDISTRSIAPELEKEARRVIEKIPQMQPGKQGTTPVDVLFTVPILFRMQ